MKFNQMASNYIKFLKTETILNDWQKIFNMKTPGKATKPFRRKILKKIPPRKTWKSQIELERKNSERTILQDVVYETLPMENYRREDRTHFHRL